MARRGNSGAGLRARRYWRQVLWPSGGGRDTAPISSSIPKATPPTVGPNHSVLPGTTEVVWFASGGLHLGNPSLGSDRVVAQVDAAATRLVSIGSRVYFFQRGSPDVSALNGGNRIAELDTGSGRCIPSVLA